MVVRIGAKAMVRTNRPSGMISNRNMVRRTTGSGSSTSSTTHRTGTI